MKRILLAMLLAFGLSAIVKAGGEGPILGQAWKDCNAVCATIAIKDPETGLWVWNAHRILVHGTQAKTALANVQAEIDACKDDEDASAVTGANSIANLQTLVNHALAAIAAKPSNIPVSPTAGTVTPVPHS